MEELAKFNSGGDSGAFVLTFVIRRPMAGVVLLVSPSEVLLFSCVCVSLFPLLFLLTNHSENVQTGRLVASPADACRHSCRAVEDACSDMQQLTLSLSC